MLVQCRSQEGGGGALGARAPSKKEQKKLAYS